MGNRFDHLQMAVNILFERIGSIQRISSVYQTPALGFKGADFFNCVLQLATTLPPAKLLRQILSIEEEMGRVRGQSQGYESRPIDLDILFYGSRQIDQKQLKVPHPELQNRRFVLEPLGSLVPDFIHPSLGIRIDQLLERTPDKSPITKISRRLKNPQDQFNLNNCRYIAIEGNIGAGKTSLASMIAADFNGRLVLERFMENPFLPKFYQDPQRFSFPLEMSFLADRYQQLLDGITQHDLFNDFVVADYDFYKSMIFAGITLAEEEFALYQKLFKLMQRELPRPDRYIYLYQDTQRLLKNIKKRGRSFERSIDQKYLHKIDTGYRNFIKSQKLKSIRLIDITELDFVRKRQDYLSVVRQILS